MGARNLQVGANIEVVDKNDFVISNCGGSGAEFE
jgi:hypothetical protein